MKKINFFGLFVGGKIMWQKMWQKCDILCTKRGIRKESGGMAKKIRRSEFDLKSPEFGQKNGGA